MTCTHPTIQTWRTSDGTPRMWGCADCHQHFVPLTQEMIDADETIEALRSAIRKLHAAKGRYHTQLAGCDLFDLVGLPNERPPQTKRYGGST